MPMIQLTAPSGALTGQARAEAQRELARALPDRRGSGLVEEATRIVAKDATGA
ncbi:hypothetical protein [Nonomuraea jabiensis]|uniref:hypothetical protein n=1 Tax=Nonomuraea jabiensis TaxID=882448 RepID=UPI003D706448